MAILKQAKNIRITVRNDYQLIAGKVVKESDRINIEAKYGNLSLNCNKKVTAQGNKENNK